MTSILLQISVHRIEYKGMKPKVLVLPNENDKSYIVIEQVNIGYVNEESFYEDSLKINPLRRMSCFWLNLTQDSAYTDPNKTNRNVNRLKNDRLDSDAIYLFEKASANFMRSP